MKKKLLSALLCVAMVASLVVGCGGKEAQAPAADATEDVAEEATGEQEVLEFYHAYYHEVDAWPVAAVRRDIYQACADEHADGPVKFEAIPVEDVLQLATNEVAGGTFPDMVDFAGNEVPLAAIAQKWFTI